MYGLNEIEINKTTKTLNLKKYKWIGFLGIVVNKTDKDIP